MVSEKIRREYHAADVERLNFLRRCNLVNDIQEKPVNQFRLASSITLVIGIELAVVFYLLSEQLGYSDSLYAALSAIATTFSCALALAFANANSTINLGWFRRQLGRISQLLCLCVFLALLGLISNWRADGTEIGWQGVVSGYKNMTELSIVTTALITLGSFLYLSYEMRRCLWPRFWGYREVYNRFQAAMIAWQTANLLAEKQATLLKEDHGGTS